MDCLKNIVGVTVESCECVVKNLTTEQRTEMAKSKSGLYLDTLPGGLSLEALQKVDTCKNMAQLALLAVSNATKQITEDLIIAINNKYTTSAPAFRGIVGQMGYASTLASVKNIQGILFRSVLPDAVIKVNGITIIVNGDVANLPINIIRAPKGSVMGVVVATYTVNTVANMHTVVDMGGEPLVLPMAIDGRPQDYYFAYDRSLGDGFNPKDNKIDCGCTGGLKNPFEAYIKPMGIQMDSFTDFTGGITDKFTRGLLVDCELRCYNEQLVCGQYNENEAISVALAKAVQFKAGEFIIEEVRKTNEVNRYTMQGMEYLYGKRNHFRTEYDTRVEYISAVIDVTATDCFVCRDDKSGLHMVQNITTTGTQADIDSALDAIGNFGNGIGGEHVPGFFKMEDIAPINNN